MTENILITKRAAAERAGVIVRTVDNWLAVGKLTKHVNGLGQVRISAEELDRLLKFQPVSAAVDSANR